MCETDVLASGGGQTAQAAEGSSYYQMEPHVVLPPTCVPACKLTYMHLQLAQGVEICCVFAPYAPACKSDVLASGGRQTAQAAEDSSYYQRELRLSAPPHYLPDGILAVLTRYLPEGILSVYLPRN
jgi:hypothetical protein